MFMFEQTTPQSNCSLEPSQAPRPGLHRLSGRMEHMCGSGLPASPKKGWFLSGQVWVSQSALMTL